MKSAKASYWGSRIGYVRGLIFDTRAASKGKLAPLTPLVPDLHTPRHLFALGVLCLVSPRDPFNLLHSGLGQDTAGMVDVAVVGGLRNQERQSVTVLEI